MIGKDKDKKPADASDITTDSADPTNPTASAPGSALSTRTSTPTPGASSKDIAPDGKTPDDSSKLRTFLSILKRFIGVTDIAAVRFSLPAQLLEPIPNLEYWHYLDRPETFVAIGDSEEPLGRMLGCLRFWFTKDLKYVHGKPCKPYNSTLGEFFRCQWDVEDTAPSLGGSGTTANVQSTTTAPASGETTKNQPIRVSYLTEQTSHHPPVSAYYVDCPDKGIKAVGYDQLSAKFTGTSIRVTAGQYNEGIWVSLQKRGEDYQLTHPAAYLGGFLRGNLSVTVADTCFVTCAQTGIKVILHYLEEGYFGKTQNKVEGVIYRCNVEKDKTTRIKDVPDKDVLGRIDGCWTDSIYFSPGATDFKKTAEKDRILLVNVSPLRPVPKTCPPLEQQLPNESQRFWHDVTHSITSKQFAAATTQKTEIEEKQRERAAERKAAGTDWAPRFFTGATVPKGRPELSSDGVLALQRLHDGNWALDPPAEYGAL